jgi:hypothetical protein
MIETRQIAGYVAFVSIHSIAFTSIATVNGNPEFSSPGAANSIELVTVQPDLLDPINLTPFLVCVLVLTW